MECIIEQAKVIFPGDPLDQKTVNIKIKNGVIDTISSKKLTGGKLVNSSHLHVSPGWIDMGVHCTEPGYEHRETLNSLSKAAINGGFTTLIVFPNTSPALHSKSEIEFIIQRSKTLPITIIPMGAVSKECAGRELAELIDMYEHGAIAFTDGRKSIQDTGLMMRALQYATHFNGLIINQPQDESLSALGLMHEGKMSQRLGMKGIPEIAETIMLKRDIDLAQYADAKLLSHLISTEEAISLIKHAKKTNSKLYSSVSYLHLVLNDTVLDSFDSVYKQSPPLRSENHRKALIKGIKEGCIDIICSNHKPLEKEKKDLEFAYATSGATGLETAFAAINSSSLLTLSEWVQCVSINPATVFNLSIPSFKEGSIANLTLFDPDIEWTYAESETKSLSVNNPFVGKRFKGRALGTISKDKISLN